MGLTFYFAIVSSFTQTIGLCYTNTQLYEPVVNEVESMKEWNLVEIMRHVRHDWLNRLQLIKGYTALGNSEKVNKIINQIIHYAEQETKLSNLSLNKLATLLMTFNWEPHTYELHYEVEGNKSLSSVDDEKITKWLFKFFQIIDKSAQVNMENELHIKISVDGEEPSFFIEFYGILKDIDEIESFLHKQTGYFKTVNMNLSQESLSFMLK